jgi:hypothetical protein
VQAGNRKIFEWP